MVNLEGQSSWPGQHPETSHTASGSETGKCVAVNSPKPAAVVDGFAAAAAAESAVFGSVAGCIVAVAESVVAAAESADFGSIVGAGFVAAAVRL